MLASHAERGEVWDKAAQYFVEALAQAVRGLAYQEAIALYDRTLGALKSVTGRHFHSVGHPGATVNIQSIGIALGRSTARSRSHARPKRWREG